MATAKQRAWRKKFAQMYGKARGKVKRATTKVYSMARRRFRAKRYSRRSSGGLMGILKPLAIGGIAGYLAPSLPVVNSLPAPAVGAGAGYFFGKKNVMGLGLGALGAMFLPNMLSGFLGGNSVNSGSMQFY